MYNLRHTVYNVRQIVYIYTILRTHYEYVFWRSTHTMHRTFYVRRTVYDVHYILCNTQCVYCKCYLLDYVNERILAAIYLLLILCLFLVRACARTCVRVRACVCVRACACSLRISLNSTIGFLGTL